MAAVRSQRRTLSFSSPHSITNQWTGLSLTIPQISHRNSFSVDMPPPGLGYCETSIASWWPMQEGSKMRQLCSVLHPARPNKIVSSVSGLALSPNVRLRCTYRSRFPGAKMKLAPSWKGFFPSRCWRWPLRLARARASAFSARRRWNRFADFNSAAR